MIISHKHKYVFIQLAKTASSAIARELCKYYSGEPILWKHARYEDFMKIATPNEKKYFIFSGIRNPLDIIVSLYFLMKIGREKNRTKNNYNQYKFIVLNNSNFQTFFRKYYSRTIYNNWKTKKFHKLNYIYKYENLQNEFDIILKKLNIKKIRPLPLNNKTPNKNLKFEIYYTKYIQLRTIICFEKYMKKWGYKFPKSWKRPTKLKKLFIALPLYSKHQIEKNFHKIIDYPPIYHRYYKLKPNLKY